MDQLGQSLQSGNLSSAQQAYSALQQDFASLELLVVIDGSTNPAIDEVLQLCEG